MLSGWPGAVRLRRGRKRPLLPEWAVLQWRRGVELLRRGPGLPSWRYLLCAGRRVRWNLLPVSCLPERQYLLPATRIRCLRKQLLPGSHHELLQRPVLPGHLHQQRHLLPHRADVRERLLCRGLRVCEPGDRNLSGLRARHQSVCVLAGESHVLPFGD